MGTNDDWLALTHEDALEPDLPICDPHHHLWEFRADQTEPRYLLDDILADTNSGHNIVSTVFIECGAMYKADGPEALRPVGETEFAAGIAAMSESGQYGPTRIAAGIVDHAQWRLLDAHGCSHMSPVGRGGPRNVCPRGGLTLAMPTARELRGANWPAAG